MNDYLDFCDRVRNGEFDEAGNESFGDELINIVAMALHGAGVKDTPDLIAERMVVAAIDKRGSFDGVLENVEEMFFVFTGQTLGF